MAYTYTEHVADGVAVTFPFRFAGSDRGYLKATDIHVELKVGDGWQTTTEWVLSGTNQVTFNTPPAQGTEIRIRRIVNKDNPYAVFDRGVALDMKALNNSFIHLLDISQEILDGFYPEGFYYKTDINMGGNKLTNLADGTEPGDSVNFGQLDAIDKKHTEWNERQDIEIEGIKQGLVSNVSHMTIPWAYVAKGGEEELRPPYDFQAALVFINGVLQHEVLGAVSVSQGVVRLAEPLQKGDEVYILVGSRIAAGVQGQVVEVSFQMTDGEVTVDIGTPFERVEVYLDGLYQPSDTYTVQGTSLVFTEMVECTLTAIITLE